MAKRLFGRDLAPQLKQRGRRRTGSHRRYWCCPQRSAHAGRGNTAGAWQPRAKQNYLRPILTGEDAWCQLFASLAAVPIWPVLQPVPIWTVTNGLLTDKIWNTSAHHADYGLLLARSDWDEPKHKGLSYFILDMRQPGVEVRQLKQMNGHASFNEVFFTDARVPRANLLGAPGTAGKSL